MTTSSVTDCKCVISWPQCSPSRFMINSSCYVGLSHCIHDLPMMPHHHMMYALSMSELATDTGRRKEGGERCYSADFYKTQPRFTTYTRLSFFYLICTSVFDSLLFSKLWTRRVRKKATLIKLRNEAGNSKPFSRENTFVSFGYIGLLSLFNS